MKRILTIALSTALLAGCGDGNPFDTDATDGGTDGGTGGSGTDGGGTGIDSGSRPPGSTAPSPDNSIFRTEARSSEDPYTGNGYAEDITYNSTDDTFSVDNLAFDGDNTYARDDQVASLGQPGPVPFGSFAVYEADAQYPDSVTSNPVNQLNHRAIYGVGQVGTDTVTEFAIVRTGAYTDYGFGGFVYQRNNDVTLPSSGQATYSGEYAGLRDFQGMGGLQYVSGDMEVSIDFDDFNDTTGTRGDAVSGFVRNRQMYDMAGNNITATQLAGLEAEYNVPYSQLPTLTFTVGPGVIDDNGEIQGEVTSTIATSDGAELFEEGRYYAIVSGADADQQIVGVIVVEHDNPDSLGGGTARETGGFIVER